MSGTPTYHYYLKDHLGNNRLVVNQIDSVVQQTDYYPFGMPFNEYSNVDNKYLYNGKEMQEDAIGNGLLDWYDYGARMYDPALGRWHSIDPLAEKYIRWSPYHYVLNNPLKDIDPDGRKIVFADNVKFGFKAQFAFTALKASVLDRGVRNRTVNLLFSKNVHTISSSNLKGGAGGFVEPASLANMESAPEVPKERLILKGDGLVLEHDANEMSQYYSDMSKYEVDREGAGNKMRSEGGDGSVLHINLSKAERKARKERGESSASTYAHESMHMDRIDQGEVVNRQVEEDVAVDAQNTYIENENRFRREDEKLKMKPCQTH